MAESRGRRRVTVVDDSPELLALLGDVLRFDGVDVSLFDGGTTLHDIDESAPDLLVLDLRLASDGLTGMQMIRHVRSDQVLRDVPIVVCSAALDEVREHEEELSRTPRVFVLPKPFSLDEFESCLGMAFGEAASAPAGR
jgi:two-component system, OmpR family, response regulator